MRKIQAYRFWMCSALFLLGFLLHIIGIRQPFLGNFAQHQTDYATVVQRWMDTSISPLHPVMRFIAQGQNRIFYGDLPLTMVLTAWIVKGMGLSIELAGRGLIALFFFFSVLAFYRILRLIFENKTALYASLFFYIFSPLALIYGQAFLLEVPALCLGLWGFYFLLCGVRSLAPRCLVLSGIFFSLMLGLRLYYAPLLVPIVFLLWRQLGWEIFKKRRVYLFFILAMAVPLSWHIFASRQAVLAGYESSLQDNLRVFVFRDSILRQQIIHLRYFLPLFDTVVNKLSTPLGFGLALLGVFSATKKEEKKVVSFLLLAMGCFLSLLFIALRKFVEFEYYFIPLIPLAAILAGLGVEKILADIPIRRWGTVVVTAITLFFSLRHSLAPMLIIPEEDRYVLKAAEIVQAYVPAGSRLIASHGSTTSFLYYCNRDGWAFSLGTVQEPAVRYPSDHFGTTMDRLEHYRIQGAGYFALADKRQKGRDPAFFEYLKKNYQQIYENDHAVIYLLHPKTQAL